MVIFTETMKSVAESLAREGVEFDLTVTESSVTFKIASSTKRKPAAPIKQRRRAGNKLCTFNGKSLTVKEWAAEYGVSYGTMLTRLRRTGSPETKIKRGKEPRLKKGN